MSTSKGAETNAAQGKAFVLNPNELTTLKTARGRKPTDSPYLDRVKVAMDSPTTFDSEGNLSTGDVHGISLTENLKASWVRPQLYKAAKQLGLDSKRITVLDRSANTSKDHPHGFVAYWVSPAGEATEAE